MPPHAAGVTFTHDMGDMPTSEVAAFDNLEHVYMQLADSGQLPIRLFAFTPLSAWSACIRYHHYQPLSSSQSGSEHTPASHGLP